MGVPNERTTGFVVGAEIPRPQADPTFGLFPSFKEFPDVYHSFLIHTYFTGIPHMENLVRPPNTISYAKTGISLAKSDPKLDPMSSRATSNQAPVPLPIFRSNSKFDQNLECFSLKNFSQPITTKFCTRHDSHTVVPCAKFRRDWLSSF